MKIMVLGGDGFCGWPTSLHLSSEGHDICIVDSLVRRAIDEELGCESLTPIRSIEERLAAWHEISGKKISFRQFDVALEYGELVSAIREFQPDAIVHFAEQRSAPYSMKNSKTKRYTVNNNINATNNLLTAVVETGLDVHVVHLGTMGVYGYGTAGMKIPEGYLRVTVSGEAGEQVQEILYPTNPGSIYHLTKSMDQLLFSYFNRNDFLRITDLHQGVVWGTQTEETKRDERLINRFDYDGDYGTVLNRFLMQAAINHPLTVYGTGGQTRAFIHIEDTVRCIEIALQNPPAKRSRVKIYNQMTETHRVRDLAKIVSDMTGVPLDFVPNPRTEADENELFVDNSQFLGHGLQPVTLCTGLIDEIRLIAEKFASRCDKSKIYCNSYWSEERRLAARASFSVDGY